MNKRSIYRSIYVSVLSTLPYEHQAFCLSRMQYKIQIYDLFLHLHNNEIKYMHVYYTQHISIRYIQTKGARLYARIIIHNDVCTLRNVSFPKECFKKYFKVDQYSFLKKWIFTILTSNFGKLLFV